MRTILFVCSGNTCRSPMAEAVAREWLARTHAEGSEEVFVASAGLYAAEGMPVTLETLHALSERGIDHSGASKTLTGAMIRKADLVLCMTAAHVSAAASLVSDDPNAVARVQRLDPEADLEDPIGMGQSAYDRLADRLQELIPRRLSDDTILKSVP